jgi:hypothetical protein
MSNFSSRPDPAQPSSGVFVERRLHPGDDVELPYEEPPAAEDGMAFERRRREVLRLAAERAQAALPPGTPSFAEVMERHRRLRAEAEAWQAAARANPEWAAQEMERMRQERLREIETYFSTRAAASGSGAPTEPPPVAPAPAPAGTPVLQGASLPAMPPVVSASPPENVAPAPAGTPVLQGASLPVLQAVPSCSAGSQPANPPSCSAGSQPANPRMSLEATGAGRPPSLPPLWEAPPEEPPAPVFLRLAATPPPPERPLKRPAPLLGKVAPLPAEEAGAAAGEWAGRWASLTTADDPLYVLLVGLNALVELRLRWASPRPSPSILNAPVRPLEPETLASWPTERLLARLGVEAEQLIEVLEAPLPGFMGWAKEALEELHAQIIGKRKDQLRELIAVLRKRLQKRRTVRRVGELVTRLAWECFQP